ncbi:MAG: cold shock domain-containing protein [Flavobacteriales bacterium]|nr:cold shock domain-containing protein [Flavobacteriales bacterium]
MKKGTVKFFDKTKGYGFIKSESGQDIFVHQSGLIDEIKERDTVTYEESQGKKGLNATEVRVVEA